MTPATVSVVVAPMTVLDTPPLADVHVVVYLGSVTGLPLDAPGVNVTLSDPVECVVESDRATTLVGAAGEPSTTTADDDDAGPVPTALVEVTVHV